MKVRLSEEFKALNKVENSNSFPNLVNCDKRLTPNLLGDNSIVVPPDPIPNSVVKRNRADDSVGSPHVKVGHCQAPNFSFKRLEKALT